MKIFISRNKKTRSDEIFVIKEINDIKFTADVYTVAVNCRHDAKANVYTTHTISNPVKVKKSYTTYEYYNQPRMNVRGYEVFYEQSDFDTAVKKIVDRAEKDYYYFITR